MSNRVAAVVPAAGCGARMGGNIPKQYLVLGGVPLLVYSLRALNAVESISEIIVVVPEADRQYCEKDIVHRFDITKVSKIVAGGRRRQDSVRNGIGAIDDPPDFVLIHDGVRPFITTTIVAHAIEAAVRSGGSIVGMIMPDTVKQADATGRILKTLNREELWLAQTPQVFRYSWIKEAHQLAEDKQIDVTDDAALIEQLGYPVTIVQGSSTNIKITRAEDLQLGEAILTGRK